MAMSSNQRWTVDDVTNFSAQAASANAVRCIEALASIGDGRVDARWVGVKGGEVVFDLEPGCLRGDEHVEFGAMSKVTPEKTGGYEDRHIFARRWKGAAAMPTEEPFIALCRAIRDDVAPCLPMDVVLVDAYYGAVGRAVALPAVAAMAVVHEGEIALEFEPMSPTKTLATRHPSLLLIVDTNAKSPPPQSEEGFLLRGRTGLRPRLLTLVLIAAAHEGRDVPVVVRMAA
jgi:hypothetical protein